MRSVLHDLPVPGDLIWIRRRQWRVRSATAGDGLARVVVESLPSAEPRTFLLPCDRWTRGAARPTRVVSPGRALAWLAASTARVHPAFTPSSILDSRAALLGYQLEPALAALAGRRRILIADDVGLGKTIQAALIIAETVRRRADARVLVLVPASLLLQWASELQARFGVAALTADANTFARLRADRPYLGNPWQGPGVWLASPDYLKQPHVVEALPRSPLDLVVIDEAHAMCGNSQRHSAIDAIARTARHVILLTATPHDGDETRFRRLLAMGATGSRADSLLIFRRDRAGRPRSIRRLEVNAGPGLSLVLSAIDGFEQARQSGAPADGLRLICSVFRKRALSSIAALKASLARRLAVVNNEPEPAPVWTQATLAFEDTSAGQEDEDVMSAEEWSALRALTGLPQARERAWLQRLLAAADRASALSSNDRKLSRLASLLRRAREPVVVFTEYRDSLLAIADALTEVRRVAVLHGALAGAEQRRALSAFLDGHADTLLATDVASQGLNLQHRARWVVHFDLPWTPMRVEQRVGRVDRIGQSRPVHVTVLGVRHPADAALRRRIAVRQQTRDAAPLPNCARWTHAANGLTRLFARQRALADRWRGPDPVALPRARVAALTLRRLCGGTTSPVAIVEIPIVTGAGDVIETRIGWLAWAAGPAQAGGRPAPALVRRARVLAARAQRRLARLQAAQIAEQSVVPHQPGLFEPRGLAGSFDDERGGEVAAELSSPAAVQIGPARPVVILEKRR